MKPDSKLIDSMALRYRHDFGFLDEQTQNMIRTTMTQLWEEVVGIGFYKGETLYTEERVKQQALLLRWLLKHYSTHTTNDGLFCYVDSLGKEVDIKDILSHYNTIT